MGDVNIQKSEEPKRRKSRAQVYETVRNEDVKKFLKGRKFGGEVLLKNGKIVKVNKERALEIAQLTKYFPYKKYAPPAMFLGWQRLAMVERKFSLVNYIAKTKQGDYVTIPLKTAEEFFANTKGNFMDLHVDQPWWDHTIYSIPIEDIVSIVRTTGKTIARVRTKDKIEIKVSMEDANRFKARQAAILSGQIDMDEDELLLARLGISVTKINRTNRGRRAASNRAKKALAAAQEEP